MNKLFTTFLLLTCSICNGQNLVPNGDFEEYYHCPSNDGQIDSAKYWINPSIIGTPDYFNPCTTGNANAPNTWIGFQQARSGVAFAGIFLFILPNANYREYIEVPLDSSLIANECYHFEMYINFANIFKYNTYNIGVYFSNSIIANINNQFPLSFIPQI
ncbi:MAG TPA: hypothetical protein VK590_06135, partial [Saprospiraceae bacterium]|nr:hypothetical protein [Saprospiraceae bacterium]